MQYIYNLMEIKGLKKIYMCTAEVNKGLWCPVNSVCVCVFKKFQDLRKKKDEMKTVKVPRRRKRRRLKKGVRNNIMKM